MTDEAKRGWRGEYPVAVDSKWRIGIKPALKEFLGNEFIVCRGPDNCMYLFEPNEWEIFYQELKDANNYFLMQVMGGSGTPVTLDGQSRLSIPKFARDWCEFQPNSTVSVIGQGRWTEVWESGKWKDYLKGFTTERFLEAVKSLR